MEYLQAYIKHRFDFDNCDEICLVDDEEINHLINGMLLNRLYPQKYIIKFLAIGEALEYLQSAPIKKRIVFLDLNIGNDTGFDFLAELNKQNLSGLNVAILTTSQLALNKKVAFQFEQVGAFLVKPLSSLQLQAMIDLQ